MDQRQLSNQSQQPLNLTVQTGGGGGGFFSRMAGAIIASCLISGIGYLGVYTTLFARAWLKHEGANVEMPLEKKAKPGIVARGHSVLSEAIDKIKAELAQTKETATGGLEKAKNAGAQLGTAIAKKVDKTTVGIKQVLAHRQEQAKQKADADAKALAEEKAKYDIWAAKFRAFYDGMCTNPRCRAPLNLKIYPPTKVMHCVKCRTSFKVYQTRLLGKPEPPPFRPSNSSLFGKLIGR